MLRALSPPATTGWTMPDLAASRSRGATRSTTSTQYFLAGERGSKFSPAGGAAVPPRIGRLIVVGGLPLRRGRLRILSTPVADPVENQERICVYDLDSIRGLAPFASMVHRSVVDWALVYLEVPIGRDGPSPGSSTARTRTYLNWAAWVRDSTANDRRQLIHQPALDPVEPRRHGLQNLNGSVGAQNLEATRSFGCPRP